MYNRILVAVDGSSVSDRALEKTIKLVGLNGGKLRIITIVDSLLRHPPDYTVHYNPESPRGAALKAADDVLAKAREKVETSNVEGATLDHICQERAGEEVAECIELEAQASDTNVVVTGTHGCCGIRRPMLGSVAEGLIRVASRSVLLVRDK